MRKRRLRSIEQSGPAALGSALQATEKSSGVSATFFDESGKELSGRTVPPGAGELIAKAAQSREIEFNFAGRNTLVARPVVSAKGQRYTYVAYIPRPPFQPSLADAGSAAAGCSCNRRHLLFLARALSHDAAAETSHDYK